MPVIRTDATVLADCRQDNQACAEGFRCVEQAGDWNCVADDGNNLPSHCYDGALSGDESSVDCGGACPGCEIGATCNQNSDCLSQAAKTALA